MTRGLHHWTLAPRHTSVWLVILVSAIACGDGSTGLEECGETVSLSVNADVTPEFTWSPSCLISGITVVDAADRATWIVEHPDNRNTVAPPVVYGRQPAGTIRLAGVTPLQTGFPYRVVLFRVDRSTGQVLVEALGETVFIP